MIFTFAYGEAWMPYSTEENSIGSEGLRGGFDVVALVRPGVDREELKRPIEQWLARLYSLRKCPGAWPSWQ